MQPRSSLWGALPLLAACDAGPVVLEDAHNFSYTGDVHVPAVLTAPSTDLIVCWDQVLQDLQCHGLDPAEDVDLVSLVRFTELTEQEVSDKLAQDDLKQADLSGYVEWENPGETCTTLSAMSFRGTPIDVASEYTLDGGTYLLSLASGGQLGSGTRMLSFLTPTADSEVAEVAVGGGCGVLDFTADLASLAPVVLDADGPWEVDWSSLSRTGIGNGLSLSDIDGLSLAFYAGQSRADLAGQFLDLAVIADVYLETGISGTLSLELETVAGFDGPTGDGTWLLALTCSRCANPAPLFLTALEAE